MAVLALVFCVFFLITFLFGTFRINEIPDNRLRVRVSGSIVVGLIMDVIVGLPALGIIYLLKSLGI